MATENKNSKTEELNLDTKVTVRNLAGWDVYFTRIQDGVGDVRITPSGNIRISRGEIIAQVQKPNTLFAGIDGMGSHATLFIDDEATRLELGFDHADGTKQNILTDDKVKAMFAIKQQQRFEEEFKKEIITRAEQYAIIQAIKRLGINDYSKIRFIEKTTGFIME